MKKLVWILLVCSMLLLLASCSAAAAPVTTATEARDQLTPYHTATLTPTFTATPLNQPTSTPRPTITPTPRTYVVHANDTFLSIAYYYGITLDELVAANPNINPALMPIGTHLIIPRAGSHRNSRCANPHSFWCDQRRTRLLSISLRRITLFRFNGK